MAARSRARKPATINSSVAARHGPECTASRAGAAADPRARRPDLCVQQSAHGTNTERRANAIALVFRDATPVGHASLDLSFTYRTFRHQISCSDMTMSLSLTPEPTSSLLGTYPLHCKDMKLCWKLAGSRWLSCKERLRHVISRDANLARTVHLLPYENRAKKLDERRGLESCVPAHFG